MAEIRLASPLLNGPTPVNFYYGRGPAGWSMLNQTMVSKSLLTGRHGLEIEEKSLAVFRPKRIRDGSKPKPLRKRQWNWLEGPSDHFPITATLGTR